MNRISKLAFLDVEVDKPRGFLRDPIAKEMGCLFLKGNTTELYATIISEDMQTAE